MRYINKYNTFINESSILIKDGPGKQLKDFLDSNLESFVVAMSDDGFQKIELKYTTNDDIWVDIDILKEIPSCEKFEEIVIDYIKSARKSNNYPKEIRTNKGFGGKISLLISKFMDYKSLGVRNLNTRDGRSNLDRIFNTLDREIELQVKKFLEFTKDYDYSNTSTTDDEGIRLEYYIYLKK